MKFDITFINPVGHPETYVAIEAENEQAAQEMKDSLLTAAGSFWPVDQWTIASVVPTPTETPPADPTLMPMYYPTTEPVLTLEQMMAKLTADAQKAAAVQLAAQQANPPT
jgi:hypothetical protein